MSLIADIFITHKPGREELALRSISSFFNCTDKKSVRTHLIVDGPCPDIIHEQESSFDHVLIHNKETLGLGPSINQALAHIQSLNEYFEHPTHGDKSQVAPFIVYCQDDLLYTAGWLEKLIKNFLVFEKPFKIGFASGLECVEHTTKKDLGNGLLLKDWIRAANMVARREYWMSMFPIPRFDPETRQVRAKPNDGMGSGVDWHFIRNHTNSVCRTGKTCLVIPGLLQHAGFKESTWLKRELPESESDKKVIENV